METSPSLQQCCRINKNILRGNSQMTNFDDYIDVVNPSIAFKTMQMNCASQNIELFLNILIQNWLLELD